jgi:hypothetical protein
VYDCPHPPFPIPNRPNTYCCLPGGPTAQSKEAINAILKPLEVLTRILPKHAVAPSERSGQELGSAQQGAQPNPTTTSSGAAPGREQGLQQGGQGELGAAAEVRPGPTAAAATHTRTGAAAPSPHSVQGHAAPDSQQPDAVGRTVMDEDIRDSRQGEAAAGPAALAAAGRYVPGGARLGRQREGDVLDQLLEHYVDIQVRLGSDDSGDDDDDDDDEDGSEPSSSVVDGDDDGHPADASDEEMADGHDGSGSEEVRFRVHACMPLAALAVRLCAAAIPCAHLLQWTADVMCFASRRATACLATVMMRVWMRPALQMRATAATRKVQLALCHNGCSLFCIMCTTARMLAAAHATGH